MVFGRWDAGEDQAKKQETRLFWMGMLYSKKTTPLLFDSGGLLLPPIPHFRPLRKKNRPSASFQATALL